MYQLRPYQQEVVDKVIHYFKKKRLPAVVVLPTGAGKSLVIAELAKIAKGRVLSLAHVKELVEQNHSKYESYGLKAGVFSAGLNKKETDDKVIFGSIQSVARAQADFFKDFTLLVIDECHRVGLESDSQYASVIRKLRDYNPNICILGLTATPYRLGLGWIYNFHQDGSLMTNEARFFRQCIYELSLEYMIENKYLTKPIKIDLPVTCYDFSDLVTDKETFSLKQIERKLKEQRALTPLIVKNIVDIVNLYNRTGVMIFCSTIKHAKEVLEYLPEDEAELIVSETQTLIRADIIDNFKQRKIKYLVNVSVLTTGFDAPHVDVIAILRPTESVSLYQQIIGRGLRLDTDKSDCLVLDYAGIGHNIYQPQVRDKKPRAESVLVNVPCPECGYVNEFWGLKDLNGEVKEHYGRACYGGRQDPETLEIEKCSYLFRYKICDKCFKHNHLNAKCCQYCDHEIKSPEDLIKQAKLSKDAHVLEPEHIEIDKAYDKDFGEFLQIRYFDYNGDFLEERFTINGAEEAKIFHVNFIRSHKKRPEIDFEVNSIDEAINSKELFRYPAFVIGRKKSKKWYITEKIFTEELTR